MTLTFSRQLLTFCGTGFEAFTMVVLYNWVATPHRFIPGMNILEEYSTSAFTGDPEVGYNMFWYP
jgi:hypothetical protein